MGKPRFARLLAPLALVVCAAAVLAVVQNGLKEGTGDAATTRTTTTVSTTKASSKVKRYRVRSGDTLGGISAKVDVPVDTILGLNPKVDPQTLRAGQLLRVRR
jgi:LysM repeat protein